MQYARYAANSAVDIFGRIFIDCVELRVKTARLQSVLPLTFDKNIWYGRHVFCWRIGRRAQLLLSARVD